MSKKQMIITIGREFGSGGHEIGEKLAKELGIPFYDKNLIEIAAKHSGLSHEVVASSDEKAPGFLVSPYTPSISDQLFIAQSTVIRNLAKTESFVIVGRCSNSVLSDEDNVLNVFIYAPLEKRINRIMDRFLISSPDRARKEILRTDKVRKSYYQYYSEYDWGNPEGYDLLIDSSKFGIDLSAKVLATIAREKFNDES